MPSLFSRIIAGSIPGEFIFRDDAWVAFLDINPVNPGHALLVPVAEVPYVGDLPPLVLAGMGDRLARLIACVKAATGAPAVNVVVNDGPEAGQEIPHAHLHVIPRGADGQAPWHWQRGAGYAAGGLAAMGTALRARWQ